MYAYMGDHCTHLYPHVSMVGARDMHCLVKHTFHKWSVNFDANPKYDLMQFLHLCTQRCAFEDISHLIRIGAAAADGSLSRLCA